MGITLRPAAAGDAMVILRLAREMAVSGAGQGVPDDDAAGSAWAAGWIHGHTQEGRRMLVAEVDGRAAGFATASAGPSPTLAHVAQLSLFVSADWRRKGIGRQLLDALIQWAAQSPGIDKLQLAVLASNSAAIGLYRRCGFREEGRLLGQVRRPDGERADQLLMARGVDRTPADVRPAPPPGPGPAASADRVCLERDVRFGDSLLWTLQRRYFLQQGMAAWRAGTVPHYITSNPLIAEAYAGLVAAWQDDLAADGARATTPAARGPDGAQPLYVIELGAGCGRFAFHFLKCFFGDPPAGTPGRSAVTYVMTDFVEENLRFWQSHPRLKAYVDAGRLDFALFDPTASTGLELRVSGRRLAEGGIERPPVVIANYVLDGLPQDAFTVADGQLRELTVSLHSPAPVADRLDPALLERLELRYGHAAVAEGRYADAACAAVLAACGERLDGSHVLIPTAALRCLDRLRALARGSLLFIAADKGFVDPDALPGQAHPAPALHGSFSLPVNFHAIGQVVRARGGEYWFPAHPAERLAVCAYALGARPRQRSHTRSAYGRLVAQSGPDDAYALKKSLERHHADLDLDELLAWVRASRYDANVLLACRGTLMRRLPQATASQLGELRRVVAQVRDNFYAIGEHADLALALGTLLVAGHAYAEARALLEESLQVNGPSHAACFGLAVCHQQLGDIDAARTQARRAVDLAPTPADADAVHATLAALAGQPDGSAGDARSSPPQTLRRGAKPAPATQAQSGLPI